MTKQRIIRRREKWEPLWMRCGYCQHEFLVVVGDVDWFRAECPKCGTTSEFARRKKNE